ncbi:unnamed protein product [Ambrosiozyma monospora]|uniref:Unnamed protein product n=1 Tax=Ambrosiozyma monospora TaxID=43982 RepID=A0ACB5TD03_AMBMO|nr:unnamed protein product [Ambrosiozyma monospora]
MIVTGELAQYDLVVIDQLSYCIPLLHWFKKKQATILFYCHFPDKLLASRGSLIRRVYRIIFDFIEEWSTGFSDKIVVNSYFTMETVKKTMPSLASNDITVVYPCVPDKLDIDAQSVKEVEKFFQDSGFFMSINRFDSRKKVDIAVKAFANYVKATSDISQKLVIAGGYDDRVPENAKCFTDLKKLCDNLKLTHTTVPGSLEGVSDKFQVYFMPSIATKLKNALLSKTDMLLYTPDYEHFGIVPLEAMVLGKPVLAHNTGGPLETIVNYFDDDKNFTGFNVEHDALKWSDVLELIKSFSKAELAAIGERANVPFR